VRRRQPANWGANGLLLFANLAGASVQRGPVAALFVVVVCAELEHDDERADERSRAEQRVD